MPRATTPHGLPEQDVLLATKLYAPAARPGLVPRPRLLARLDRGLAARLILVSAPAGAGKTTLLGDWLGHCACPCAWVSLDAGDNDPIRFFRYVTAAVDGVMPGSGETARELLGLPQVPPLETVLTRWLNDLCTLAGQVVLVLDDYHAIEAEAIHTAMAFLIDHLPPQLRLVIATRADPLLPLARLRVRGELLELGADDLRFSEDEAAAFLNQTMGLALSASDVAALEARTEGWASGLQMAALSLQGREDVAAFVQAFGGSHRYVLDYLLEEVLERQPETVQAFLLQTCVLARLTAPLCEAVTGQPGAQAMLERLEGANLFLVPLDDERRWYRYHQLFAGLLRARSAEAGTDMAALRVRASAWCEGEGLTAEAVDYALAAEDFERAARLAEAQGPLAYAHGGLRSLHAWIERLPADVVAGHPLLCAYSALASVMMGQLAGVEALLQAAEEGLPGRCPAAQARDLLGTAAVIRGYAAFLEADVERAAALTQQARAGMVEGNPLHVLAAFTMGDVAYLRGDMAGAHEAWSDVLRLARAAGNERNVAGASIALALTHRMRGELDAALALAHQALAVSTRPGARQVGEAAQANVSVAAVLYERNALEAAEAHILAAVHSIQPGEDPSYAAVDYTALACLRLARQDLAGAAEALEEAGRRVSGRWVYSDVSAEWMACRVRLWLAQGRGPGGEDALAEAVRWADEQRPHRDGGLGWVEELEQISVARVRLAQGRPGEALEVLAGLAEAAEAGGRTGRRIEILALQALAFRAQGRAVEAREALAQALTLAEPAGYVRLFLDEGPAMVEMLGELRELHELRGYIERLLAHGEQPAPSVPPTPLLEPLSARELEVLRLAAAGLSNREIAERLIIAVGTVKTHLHNIYGKLGVRSRTQALVRARELGLA